MTKTKNRIITLTISILILLIGFFGFAFHAMEIEDHYGDLQNFYFKSKSGDIMILGEYEKIGLVDKTWKRMRVINSKRDTVDLYNWFYDDRHQNDSNKLFRVKGSISIDELEKEIIIQKIQRKEFKEILSMLN